MKTYQDNTGYRVDVSHEDSTFVTYHRSGGGLQSRMPTLQFHELFRPADPLVWRHGYTTAEWLGYDPEVRVTCWSDGQLWNGWATPAFEREQVEQLMAAQPGMLVWDGDKVVAHLEGADPADGPEEYEPFRLPNGLQVWPIGAGGWCWDSVKFDGEAA